MPIPRDLRGRAGGSARDRRRSDDHLSARLGLGTTALTGETAAGSPPIGARVSSWLVGAPLDRILRASIRLLPTFPNFDSAVPFRLDLILYPTQDRSAWPVSNRTGQASPPMRFMMLMVALLLRQAAPAPRPITQLAIKTVAEAERSSSSIPASPPLTGRSTDRFAMRRTGKPV